MALTSGDRLGPYEIASPLGAGGMGEVYRARDTRLDRAVAIKVLPDHIAHREDARARFEREARAVASLNHPNICTLFDIGPNYMVMELIEGETLAARIAKGPIPLDQALSLAAQIADALDRAHRAGVTHRDVKPHNIMVTRDGVKVLDFGLAKSTAKPGPTDETLTKVLTAEGTVVGTPQYMAPEQFEGKEADARSDIWAFGAVLYEMVTGRKAFEGKNYSSLVGAILSSDPAPMAVKPFTPAWLERMVWRCLEKDPDERYQSVRDALLDLRYPPASASDPAHKAGWIPWAIAGIALLTALGGGILAWRASLPEDKPLVRHTVDLGADLMLADATRSPTPRVGPVAILAPDESRIAFVTVDNDGVTRLHTRRLGEAKARVLEGTDGATGPFFSPDGRQIGFFSDNKLRKISADGGGVVDLCDAPAPLSATWGDGFIVSRLTLAGALMRVPESGGTPQPVTKLEPGERAHRWPHAIPGSRTILFSSGTPAAYDNDAKIFAQRLDTGQRVLVAEGSYPRYSPGGFVVFVKQGSLFAIAFDPDRLVVKGAAVPVLHGVKFAPDAGGAQFDLSQRGTALLRAGDSTSNAESLVGWIDTDGKTEIVHRERGRSGLVSLSPDGRMIAYRVFEHDRTTVWVKDIAGGQPRQMSYEPGEHEALVWAPDGRHIAYRSPKGVHWARTDGGRRPVLLLEGPIDPQSFTPDGRRLIYRARQIVTGKCEAVPLEGDIDHPTLGKAVPCFASVDSIPSFWGTRLSPDGRWLASQAGTPGQSQIVVSPFPDTGGRWVISPRGAQQPSWSPDGRRLYFLGPDARLYSVQVEAGTGAFVAHESRLWANIPPLAARNGPGNAYSPDRTGRRILTFVDPSALTKPDARVELLENFADEVRRVVAGAGR